MDFQQLILVFQIMMSLSIAIGVGASLLILAFYLESLHLNQGTMGERFVRTASLLLVFGAGLCCISQLALTWWFISYSEDSAVNFITGGNYALWTIQVFIVLATASLYLKRIPLWISVSALCASWLMLLVVSSLSNTLTYFWSWMCWWGAFLIIFTAGMYLAQRMSSGVDEKDTNTSNSQKIIE